MVETPPVNRLGYARVSTYSQTLGAQLDQLRAAGRTAIWCEQASGAQADRRELGRLVRKIDTGDMVTVTRIDRQQPTDESYL